MLPLERQNYRYTFQKATLTNVKLPEGLYEHEFRGDPVVLKVDKFGEVRIANETPCGNEHKLALELIKSKPSFLDSVQAKYKLNI